jgi:hypothetical protein
MDLPRFKPGTIKVGRGATDADDNVLTSLMRGMQRNWHDGGLLGALFGVGLNPEQRTIRGLDGKERVLTNRGLVSRARIVAKDQDRILGVE